MPYPAVEVNTKVAGNAPSRRDNRPRQIGAGCAVSGRQRKRDWISGREREVYKEAGRSRKSQEKLGRVRRSDEKKSGRVAGSGRPRRSARKSAGAGCARV
ncbi:hypothetical protein [Paenibacillus eucommiae]|uniref:Uncharacterized protein n=1 Tax=Paenibacillus eucommiae TaxID=1355755 RepID=A0ABS4IVA4_9BACL|nr:hypothetical protein [Paenibacillus eucommiae]MBP1991522.1 hypothetical protein [Paenibacillus eucommiae]